MQYRQYTVSVTKNSTTVEGAVGTKFISNVSPGNAFKVKDDPVVYTVASVTDDNTLELSAPYLGATNAYTQYQITRDYTPNFGLAEINTGDQDWPVHLTQETIRKVDAALAGMASGFTVKGGWNAQLNSPPLPAAAAGNQGWVYKVTVAGTTPIDGVSEWTVGDTVISNGTAWFNVQVPDIDLVAAAGYAATCTTKADEVQLYTNTAVTSAADAAAAKDSVDVTATTLQALLVSFRKTFLGHLAADPIVDGNGDPLLDGVTYVNTVSNKIRIYDADMVTWADYDASIQNSATNAALSASSAAASASAATSAATAASTAATNAAASADTIGTAVTDAASYANTAKGYKEVAESTAAAVAGLADTMTTQVTTATTKAAEAATKATAASDSASAAAASAASITGAVSTTQAYRDTAEGYKNESLAYRDTAEGYKEAAAGYKDVALTYRNESEVFKTAANDSKLAAAVSAAAAAADVATVVGYRDTTIAKAGEAATAALNASGSLASITSIASTVSDNATAATTAFNNASNAAITAQGFRDTAAGYSETARGYSESALASAQTSTTQATKAAAWAEAETEIEAGKRSAKFWAAQAAQIAGGVSFSSFSAGATTVPATTSADNLTITGEHGVTITGDAANKTLTIGVQLGTGGNQPAAGDHVHTGAYEVAGTTSTSMATHEALYNHVNLAHTSDLAVKADLVEGKVPASQLPSYVDDVLEYTNLVAFPASGESDKIYVAVDTNKTYRWSGSGYVSISSDVALGETAATAYRGDYGKIAYDHTSTTNNPHATSAAQVGAMSTAHPANLITGFGVSGSSTAVVRSDDTRLTDARAPLSHAMDSHADWPPAVTTTELGYLEGVTSDIQEQLGAKQATLISGTNVKTVNNTSILGSGNITISGGNPPGTLVRAAAMSLPGHLRCDGSSYTVASYPDLAAHYVDNWVGYLYSRVSCGVYPPTCFAYGNGMYVAGCASGYMYYSTDLVTWNLSPSSPMAGNFIQVLFANGIFVALANPSSTYGNYLIFTSVDGITWTGRFTYPNANPNKIIYENGYYVVVVTNSAMHSTVIKSQDAITWNYINYAVSTTFDTSFDVMYREGYFIVIGTYNSGYYSVVKTNDFVTWTAIPTISQSSITKILYTNNTYLALGYSSTYRSSDFASWSSITNITQPVYVFNNKFVYINGTGTSATLVASSDAVTWTIQSYIPSYVVGTAGAYKMYVANGALIVSGTGGTGKGIIYTFDCVNWYYINSDYDTYNGKASAPHCIEYLNGTLLLGAIKYQGSTYAIQTALAAADTTFIIPAISDTIPAFVKY